MSLNPQQKQIVETLQGSINVVAGAGTGKTFTLTQRIVEAVKDRLNRYPDDEDPSGHLLAITFTNKAASELKSRVRQAFLEEASKGGNGAERYLECALSIDDAWISTIHGMAGRILRENAIDFRIDPGFLVLTEEEEDVIFLQAVEEAYRDAASDGDPVLEEFLRDRNVDSGQWSSESLARQVKNLLSATSYMPNGIDGTVIFESLENPYTIAETFLKSGRRLKQLLSHCVEQGIFTKTNAEKAAAYLEDAKNGVSRLEEFTKRSKKDISSYNDDASFHQIGRSSKSLVRILASFPKTTDKFGSKTDFAEEFDVYRKSLKNALDVALSNLLALKDGSFLRFSRMVEKRLAEIKSRGASKMSQSDVLTCCDRLLGKSENAFICDRYRDKFEVIMLDEFQDTDKLQMSLIGKIARVDKDQGGSTAISNLCTVGDMQQSIYRFRGGDVELSQKRAADIASEGGIQLELSSNYRSHPAVLDAVEMIFSRPGVFGDDFLRLDAACSTLDDKCREIFENEPRITFDFLHGGKASDKSNVSLGEVRKIAAKRIAVHFRSLKEKGVPPKDMALLLGTMNNANLYVDALKDVGLESAVTAGSLFSEMEEPALISELLKFATNPKDDCALFQILVSPLFEVSDDALLLLCREKKEEGVKGVRLSRAFASFDGFDDEHRQDEESVSVAKEILDDFIEESKSVSAHYALKRLFARSGWLLELEESSDAQSLVSAGTIKKAIDIVANLEGSTTGLAETAHEFETFRTSSKESPGTLVTSSSDFIQIMTVHSSKGLEFKHVAIAEMRDGITKPSPVNLTIENVDDNTYISFSCEKSDFGDEASKKQYDDLSKFDSVKELHEGDEMFGTGKNDLVSCRKSAVKDAESHSELLNALQSYSTLLDLNEARRLMYVALTRARESLYVSFSNRYTPKSSYKGVFKDVFDALCDHFDTSEDEMPHNASFVKMPISLNRCALASDEMRGVLDGEEVPEDEKPAKDPIPETRKIPIYPDTQQLVGAKSDFADAGERLCSYSKLSEYAPEPSHGGEDIIYESIDHMAKDFFVDDASEMVYSALMGSGAIGGEVATDLGTAFHRLAQASILEMNEAGTRILALPKGCTIKALSDSLDLTHEQSIRLGQAFDLWVKSEAAKRFASHEQVIAEAPFNVSISNDSQDLGPFVLYGQIDGLAVDDGEKAFFVDYKTGNRDEDSQMTLSKKYEFQAKCYSYALLASGFKAVEAEFVLVEKPVHEPGDERIEPMCIGYSFSSGDVPRLKSEIIEAYTSMRTQNEPS